MLKLKTQFSCYTISTKRNCEAVRAMNHYLCYLYDRLTAVTKLERQAEWTIYTIRK